MTDYYNFDAALFTRMVSIGEKNPKGEAAYKGYRRVKFVASKKENLSAIEFPEAEEDYRDEDGNMVPVVCLAAIDGNGVVVGVKEL